MLEDKPNTVYYRYRKLPLNSGRMYPIEMLESLSFTILRHTEAFSHIVFHGGYDY